MSWEPRGPSGDFEDPFKKIFQEFEKILKQRPGGSLFKGWRILVLLLVAGFLLWKGFYIVAPDEQGIVLRFGEIVRTTLPGPHFKIPLVEKVLLPKITKLHRIEIGFRSVGGGASQTVPAEALMVTGDENIVAVELIVQYRVKDAEDFLFQVADVEDTIKSSAEAAVRQVIGETNIDDALTIGKAKIQIDAQAALQTILDEYQAGVQIAAVQLQDVNPPDAVAAAFKDVASAKEDKEKLINESHGYRNDIMPKAKGEAAQVVNEAQAYTEARVRRAEGEADRFLKTLKEYKQSEEIIRKRIFIETMEEVMAGVGKIIIDESMSGKVLPYLPLERKGLPSPASKVVP